MASSMIERRQLQTLESIDHNLKTIAQELKKSNKLSDREIKEHNSEVEEMRSTLTQAIVDAVEHVGFYQLPPVPGWPWYDAMEKYAPAELHKLLHPELSFDEDESPQTPTE